MTWTRSFLYLQIDGKLWFLICLYISNYYIPCNAERYWVKQCAYEIFPVKSTLGSIVNQSNIIKIHSNIFWSKFILEQSSWRDSCIWTSHWSRNQLSIITKEIGIWSENIQLSWWMRRKLSAVCVQVSKWLYTRWVLYYKNEFQLYSSLPLKAGEDF